MYYPGSPKTTVHRTEDGSVVAWGEAERGGDCSKVKDQLHDIQQLAGSGHSMAFHSARKELPCEGLVGARAVSAA